MDRLYECMDGVEKVSDTVMEPGVIYMDKVSTAERVLSLMAPREEQGLWKRAR